MIDGLRVAVIMPAYNASATLQKTFASLPMQLVDDVILTDDSSKDDTVAISKWLGIHTIEHPANRGRLCSKGAALPRIGQSPTISGSVFRRSTGSRSFA